MTRLSCAGLLLVLLSGLATGCSYHKKIPPGIISKEKMEKILWDMVQADRFTSGYILTKKDSFEKKKEEAALFYERVFHLHGITREEFVKSYKYYLGRPDITKTLFDSIAVQAERRRDAALQRVQDSVAKRHHDSLELLNKVDTALAKGSDSLRLEPGDSASATKGAIPLTAEDSFRQRMKFADSVLKQVDSGSLTPPAAR